ncbi:hypothetical protein GA0115253_1041510 [Streptomyces sp. Termitarium-T10T-6]|nr:hypothetical protein GA0115253_1041510 [Streptomyces sp. Termitarium-T10T-6]
MSASGCVSGPASFSASASVAASRPAGDLADTTTSSGRPEGSAGAGSGACSSTTWALVPPIPKEPDPESAGGRVPLGPGAQFRVDEEGGGVEVDARVGALEVQAGHQRPVVQLQHGLDETGDARGRFEMPDVRLDGADGAEPRVRRVPSERPAERRDLDGITDVGARAVRLDRGDRPGWHPAVGDRGGDHGFLAAHARGGVTDLLRAVVVHRGALEDGEDPVAVAPGVGQPLEHDRTGAVAEDRARAVGVERAAAPVRRVDQALFVAVADPVRHPDAHPSGQGDLAVAGAQGSGGLVHGHQ